MRVVFVAQRLVYPPDAGTPIRNYNLALKATEHHEVHVFGFGEPERSPEPLLAAGAQLHLLPAPPARGRGERLLTMLTTTEPDMARRSYSVDLLRLLERELPRAQPDVVQLQALDMAYVLPTVRRAAPQARVILDQHNAEYVLQRRALAVDLRRPKRWPVAVYSAWQSLTLRRYERQMCGQCDAVLTMSDEDARALRALGIETPIAVVPNGVDLAAYQGCAPAEAMERLPGPHFVFPGKMDFRPNVDAAVWFAQSALPLIRRQLPEARFWVVGRSPHPSVLALRQLPNVDVTGEVPDTRPYIAGATAVVVPLRIGAGTKLKVLEAAALRRPLVVTPVGIEGYDAVPGQDALVADTPEELAAACIRVATDSALAEALGAAAFANLAQPLDWSNVYERLEAVYAGSGPN
ncbi:MAG: glycosyltransferase family 4 protein [Anaerolineae bacterium]|jgi:glycosyltransferase involved in cell wall biosynthesis